MRLRISVLTWFVVVLSGISSGQQVSECWWGGCRVANQRPNHRSQTLALTDPSYQHVGLPLPPSFRRPEEKTPDKFVIVECQPEKNLQEGDILLQVNPIKMDAKHAYDLLMTSPHAAIVAKKPDGSLYALGTPRNYWPQGKLNHASYHILRLREYPTEITSPQVLAEWRSNPVKYRKIKDWQEQRQQILAKIKKGIEFFEKNVPYYDAARETQILDPKQKAQFERWILGGETCDEVPSQYCSELVATIYSVAGANLPKVKTARFYFDRLANEIIPQVKKEGETDWDTFQQAIDAFFENTDTWSNLGVDEEEKQTILEKRQTTGNSKLLPDKIARFKRNIEWVWGFPAFIRNGLIAWSGLVGNANGVITPFDFLDAVRDSTSDYSYVGTYLKSACETPGQGPTSRHLMN